MDIVYRLIHVFILWLARWLLKSYHRLIRLRTHIAVWLQCWVNERTTVKRYESRLLETLRNDPKIPRHIAFVLQPSNEPIHIDSLVNLIEWCDFVNVPFVSFYDDEGKLLSKRHQLEKVLEARRLRANRTKKECPSETTVNGFKSRFTGYGNTSIRLLGPDDGREAITKAIVKILAKRQASKLDEKYGDIENIASYDVDDIGGDKDVKETESLRQRNLIEPQHITKELQVHYPFPAPDMLIMFGPTPCAYGFPPWQIRLTEFFHLQTHHDLRAFEFVTAVEKFTKCDRRFGK